MSSNTNAINTAKSEFIPPSQLTKKDKRAVTVIVVVAVTALAVSAAAFSGLSFAVALPFVATMATASFLFMRILRVKHSQIVKLEQALLEKKSFLKKAETDNNRYHSDLREIVKNNNSNIDKLNELKRKHNDTLEKMKSPSNVGNQNDYIDVFSGKKSSPNSCIKVLERTPSRVTAELYI